MTPQFWYFINPDQCFKHNFFLKKCLLITRVQNSSWHFDYTCRWLSLLRSANWNRSRGNVVVNISYQTINQQRNIWKTFWKHFKMSRKRRIRFGNLNHAAKVEKENSCSLWITNLFFYAFIQAWNMQVCLDKLLCYHLYVSAQCVIKT